MDITKLKVNQFIKINGKEYEIIGVMKDFECLPPKYKLRKTIYFHLLKKGNKGITPTHCMIYYLDTKKIFFSGQILGKKDFQIIS